MTRREYTNEFPAPQLPERRGNFVEPAPVRRPASADAVPQWAVPASRDQVPPGNISAWDPQGGTVEKTSATDRAQAVRGARGALPVDLGGDRRGRGRRGVAGVGAGADRRAGRVRRRRCGGR